MPIKMHDNDRGVDVEVYGFVTDYTCRTKAVTYEKDFFGKWTMVLLKAESLKPIE